jgi:hypothetical protein
MRRALFRLTTSGILFTVAACTNPTGSGDTPAPATASAANETEPPAASTTWSTRGRPIVTVATRNAKARVLGSMTGELRVVVQKLDGTIIADGISIDELRAADPLLHTIVTSAVASAGGGGTYLDAILAL